MSNLEWIHSTPELHLWLAVVCTGVACGFVAMLAVHGLHQRRRRRQQRQLGQPCRGLEVAGWEGVVTLEGRLTHHLPCQRFEDGADAAAVTAETTLGYRLKGWYPVQHISAQAEELALRLEDGTEIGLQAPVKVILGARELRPRQVFSKMDLALQRRAMATDVNANHLAHHRLTLRSLHSGEPVLAMGRLAQRPPTSGEGSYRHSTHQWVLSGGDDGVLLAHAGPSPRRLLALRGLRTSVIAAVLSGLTLLGAGLHVSTSPNMFTIELVYSEHEYELERQLSSADRLCSVSFECRVFGECVASRKKFVTGHAATCIARGSEGCIASRNCRLHDECSASGNHCW